MRQNGKKEWVAATAAALLTVAVLVVVLVVRYQSEGGLRFVRQMGAGINIGNSLDVKGVLEHKPDASVQDFETFWHNPPITQALFEAVREKGFRTVRIPVSWGEHLQKDGTVDPAWMQRVEQVVDGALDSGLYVILNTHHEAWIVPTQEKEAEVTARLCRLWEQIAQTFADRDERLVFESMNEPRLVGTDEEWTSGTEEARAVVNRMNAAFVSTVRASGGNNETRWLMLPAYAAQSRETALSELELPDDPNLIVSVHAYLPYEFAQGGQTAEWDAEDPDDTEKIDELMERIDRLFLRRRIPVMITEFGCIDQDNPDERLEWTQYYTGLAAEKGVGYIWWDSGGEFRLIDRETNEWTQPQLADLLVRQAT